MRDVIFSSLVTLSLLLAGTRAVHAKPGDLDSSFDPVEHDGRVTTEVILFDQGNAVAVQPDGKVVVAGYAHSGDGKYDVVLIRYNVDGSLDSSFGTGGKVVTDLVGGADFAAAVAIQPDEKILIAGYTYVDFNFIVARFNKDGGLDAGFGTGGVVSIPGGQEYARSLILQTDNKIVVAGYSYSEFNFILYRLNPDGSLDTTFDAEGTDGTKFDGRVATDFLERDYAVDVALQPGGGIVAVGYADGTAGLTDNFEFALALYEPNGTLVQKKLTPIGSANDYAMAVAVQSDETVVVAGYADPDSDPNNYNDDYALAIYSKEGSLIRKASIPSTPQGERLYDVAVQPDDKIIAVGYVDSDPGPLHNHDFVLMRFDPDGNLDPSFGTNGIVRTDFNIGFDEARSVVVQGDGRVIAAGFSMHGTNYDFAVARYLGDSADLAVTKTDNPDPVSVGGTLTYAIEVTNNGPDPVSEATVRDSLPSGATFLSGNGHGGSCSTFFAIPLPGLQAGCPVGGLKAGQKATVTIQVKPSAPGVLTNTATVFAASLFDPVEANNSVQITTTVMAPGETPPTPPEDLEPLPEGEGLPGEEGTSDTVTTGEEGVTEGKKDFRAIGGGGLFNCSLIKSPFPGMPPSR